MISLVDSRNKISLASKTLALTIHISMLLASTQLNTFIMQMDPHTSILRYLF